LIEPGGNTATTRFFGPFSLDFGPDGLAPGDSTQTFWDLDPQLRAGTVTFTAIPAVTAGEDGARLAIRDPTVQVKRGLSPIVTAFDVTLHAVVANVGENIVHSANMYISYVES
jgi:hypothetical protein